mgnify:CR=1 FL=1
MDKEKPLMFITNEQGEKLACEILFTFESDETKKSYVVYTDNTLDEEKNKRTYASIFDPEKENSDLFPVETEREWEIIANILTGLQSKE